MALAPLDFMVAGGGRLERTLMFPDEGPQEFEERLQKYIDEGAANAAVAGFTDATDIDGATRPWVHYRAFDAHFIRLSSSPASVTLNDQGSRTFLADQIAAFRMLAAEALAEYEAWVPPDGGWVVVKSLRH